MRAYLVGDDEDAVARAGEEAVDLDLDALARVWVCFVGRQGGGRAKSVHRTHTTHKVDACAALCGTGTARTRDGHHAEVRVVAQPLDDLVRPVLDEAAR